MFRTVTYVNYANVFHGTHALSHFGSSCQHVNNTSFCDTMAVLFCTICDGAEGNFAGFTNSLRYERVIVGKFAIGNSRQTKLLPCDISQEKWRHFPWLKCDYWNLWKRQVWPFFICLLVLLTHRLSLKNGINKDRGKFIL